MVPFTYGTDDVLGRDLPDDYHKWPVRSSDWNLSQVDVDEISDDWAPPHFQNLHQSCNVLSRSRSSCRSCFDRWTFRFDADSVWLALMFAPLARALQTATIWCPWLLADICSPRGTFVRIICHGQGPLYSRTSGSRKSCLWSSFGRKGRSNSRNLHCRAFISLRLLQFGCSKNVKHLLVDPLKKPSCLDLIKNDVSHYTLKQRADCTLRTWCCSTEDLLNVLFRSC